MYKINERILMDPQSPVTWTTMLVDIIHIPPSLAIHYYKVLCSSITEKIITIHYALRLGALANIVSIPLHIASVPFQTPFSIHSRITEPLSTNPVLHWNFTISPLSYPLPSFRPLMGVPRTGQCVSARNTMFNKYSQSLQSTQEAIASCLTTSRRCISITR